MRCYKTWFSGLVGSNGDRRTVGLDDPVGPFQPCDSMIYDLPVYRMVSQNGFMSLSFSHHPRVPPGLLCLFRMADLHFLLFWHFDLWKPLCCDLVASTVHMCSSGMADINA